MVSDKQDLNFKVFYLFNPELLDDFYHEHLNDHCNISHDVDTHGGWGYKLSGCVCTLYIQMILQSAHAQPNSGDFWTGAWQLDRFLWLDLWHFMLYT